MKEGRGEPMTENNIKENKLHKIKLGGKILRVKNRKRKGGIPEWKEESIMEGMEGRVRLDSEWIKASRQ